MPSKKKPGPKNTKAEILQLHVLHPEMSDDAIRARLTEIGVGVSRQWVQTVRAPLRKAAASKRAADASIENAKILLAPASTSAPQPASDLPAPAASAPATLPESSLVFYEVAWPRWAEPPDVIAARHNSPQSDRARSKLDRFDADRLQAVVTYRMNATSKAGAWKAVGIDPEVGAAMIRRDRELRRVLDWAAGLAEVRVASNMLRLATGLGPQAAQAATLIAERQLGWTKETNVNINAEIHERIDVRAMLASPRVMELIDYMGQIEGELQNAQLPAHEVVEGEFVEELKDDAAA